MSNTDQNGKEHRFFWETVPGVAASLIALLTAIIGCIAAIIGSDRIMSFLIPQPATPIIITTTALPVAINTITSNPPENTQLLTLVPTNTTDVVTEIATQPPSQTPRIFGFSACPEPCDGTNATKILPGGIQKIYAQWFYENIPIGSEYVRTWKSNGEVWVSYTCAWPGPTAGIVTVPLNEPVGLRSGTWEITITIDGTVLLQEQIQVNGTWDKWKPPDPKYFNFCPK